MKRRIKGWILALLLSTLGLEGCLREEVMDDTKGSNLHERPPMTLMAVPLSSLPGWRADRPAEALPALLNSCRVVMRGSGEGALSPEVWQPICAEAHRLPEGDDVAMRAFLETYFDAYKVVADEPGLFTGYFEPELEGSRDPHPHFPVPLYGPPQDLVWIPDLGLFDESLKGKKIAGRVDGGKLVPYHTREEIEDGALEGKAEPIAWVRRPEDAFFLHIQGSGRVRLPDGSVLGVGYHNANGRTYEAIGKHLIESGEIAKDQVSMQAIKKWIRQHPHEGRALMNKNPSYVFFKLSEKVGAVGSQGAPLLPGRSLAVDRAYIPLGTLLWLDADFPAVGVTAQRLQRLVVAQDTGGAIKGMIRGDLFWGAGVEAEMMAGHMKSRGYYYVLLPKGVGVLPGALVQGRGPGAL